MMGTKLYASESQPQEWQKKTTYILMYTNKWVIPLPKPENNLSAMKITGLLVSSSSFQSALQDLYKVQYLYKHKMEGF